MQRYRIAQGTRVRLSALDADDSAGHDKENADAEVLRLAQAIGELQHKLYAEKRHALLVIFQGMDTSGKDGAIRGVFNRVNPMGVHGISFGVPSSEEREHDFLWRIHQKMPRMGSIALFNRSHYEDIVAVRVRKLYPRSVWAPRYEQINAYEALLCSMGIRVVKFFLHITRDEQKSRLEARLADPKKRWKLTSSDLDDRALWPRFQRAYEDVLSRCSTSYAPWYVVPANRKWYRNLVVARTVHATLADLNPRTPTPALDPATVVIPS